MGNSVTNVDLLLRVRECHAQADDVLQALTSATSPLPPKQLYAAITQLRNATRGAHNAAQELKNRVKAKLQPQMGTDKTQIKP